MRRLVSYMLYLFHLLYLVDTQCTRSSNENCGGVPWGGKNNRERRSEGRRSCFIRCDLHRKMTGKLPGDTQVVMSTCWRNTLKVHGSGLWPTTGTQHMKTTFFSAHTQFEDTGMNFMVLTGVLFFFTFASAHHRCSFLHSNICSHTGR